jgi:MinD superfamily P-loop ATPase
MFAVVMIWLFRNSISAKRGSHNMVVRQIDYNKCSNCGVCYRNCPMNVYAKCDDVIYIRYQLDCMSCFLCVMDCPKNALLVDGVRGREIPFPY